MAYGFDRKELKIERKVLDERTLLAIHKLLGKGFLKSVESVVKEGKESVVFSAKDKLGKWLALKVYRIEYCDFKSMWKYLVGDPRFSRVKKAKRAVVYNWCKREFKNLKVAHKSGVSCPKPIAFNENVLVIQFIGENGLLAPRLIDLKFDKTDSEKIYEYLIDQIKRLYDIGLVHADLSAFNILFYDKPYLIDFSHAVPLRHPQSEEFLRRDIKNINVYFKKSGVEVKIEEEILRMIR